MTRRCSYCLHENPPVARFCRECGRALPGHKPDDPDTSEEALSCPRGFTPCIDAPDLYYRWEAVGSGSFFGCEYLGLTLVNGGPPRVEVELRLIGRGADHAVQFELHRKLHRIDRGQSVSIEVPRPELPDVPQHLDVTLVSAKRPPDHDSSERRQSCQRPWWSSSWEEDS